MSLTNTILRAAALAATLALGACGGRAAMPVATVAPGDNLLSCDQITAMVSGNESQIAALAQEERRARAGNVAIGVVGAVLFWPALFALDTTNTEQVEMASLRSRNGYLASLGAQRCQEPAVAARR
jgi:hypothetical protein